MSSGSVNSLEAARRDIVAGLRAMDATVRNLGQGMVKVYEEVYFRNNLKVWHQRKDLVKQTFVLCKMIID